MSECLPRHHHSRELAMDEKLSAAMTVEDKLVLLTPAHLLARIVMDDRKPEN